MLLPRQWRCGPARRLAAGLLVLAATAVATGGLAAPAAADEGTIRVSPGAKTVADQYIVVLKEGMAQKSQTAQTASAIAEEHGGGTVGATWQHALHGFVINTGEQNAKRIAADPRVAYVEQDAEVRVQETQPTPASLWGLDRLDQRTGRSDGQYISSGSAGRNVHAYVLDTGIRTTHTDLGGRATWGVNTTGDGNNSDCNGHGTHVAGTIGGRVHGVAKGVTLVAVKVLDCSGSGTTAGVIDGVNWVTQHAVRPAVANMSLGGSASSALDTAVDSSINSGITYTVAAGNNNGDACNTSPARAAAAITVGATNSTDVRPTNWPFGQGSNFGSCLDIFAPGDNITSLSNASDTGTRSLSGTSMAAPHAAGVAALYLQRNPNASTIAVWIDMIWQATPNVVINPGAGSPNMLLNSRYTFGNPDGDYNGDQRTDTTVWRPSTGQWFVRNISTTQWGAPSDIPVPGDYNGDGITDLAVWRPSTGQWHVFGQFSTTWGVQGDIPVPADYNGDEITDVAVWRPSTGQWFVKDQFTSTWGVQGDIPVPADHLGDGHASIAVWRPSTGTWFLTGGFFGGGATVQWGQNGDIPVAADYNGDGGSDLTVWRPSTGQWFVRNISTTQWGAPSDKPVPGDYNGDGITDLAVWRPSTGQWHVFGQFSTTWGISSDIPLAS